MSRPKSITETRFEYLQRTVLEHLCSDTRDACLIWPFGQVDGYGILAYRPDPTQPRLTCSERTHRLAYFLLWEEWPLPLGRHLCNDGEGDPLCYNPLHVVAGTDAENTDDKKKHGQCKGAKGEANASSKLTDALVVEIRRRSFTERKIDIARSLGLSWGTVERAILGTTWAHVAGVEVDSQHYTWLKKAVAEHGDNPACLLWPFPVSKNSSGPKLRVDGEYVMAHHYAYKLLHGIYPKPCGVRTCKALLCVNPYHTIAAKQHYPGANATGETNGSAKLTWEIVRKIRTEYQGESQQSIADRYNVSQTLISLILRGVLWIENTGPDSESSPIAYS
jgi:hypothetical protein